MLMARVPNRLAGGDPARGLVLASEAAEALKMNRRTIVWNIGEGLIPGAVQDQSSGIWLVPQAWVQQRLREQVKLRDYVPAKAIAARTGHDKRTVVRACARGEYEGAYQLGHGRHDWMIPKRYLER
jgi:hypothetical protein